VTTTQRLVGRVALITGAATGIGAAFARLFAEHGAAVVVTDLDRERGKAVAQECGPEAVFHELDVTSEEQWTAATAAAVDRFGGLDVLVNNAGGTYGRNLSLERTSLADYEFVIGLNLTGQWLGLRAAIAPMRARGGGSVIGISSLAGLVGFANLAAYTTAKWGVRGLTKAAANELAADGIRVNSIHPGYTLTRPDAHDATAEEIAATGAFRGARVPLGRIATPEEMAQSGLFLASDESAYVTGIELTVDGGALLSPMSQGFQN
jgi:3alpha(or 20beta)-hydroxysteroid dehydrogenase